MIETSHAHGAQDGVQLVYARFDEGKRTLQDLIDWFSTRQKLEEHYAKDLQKMCSKPAASAEGRYVHAEDVATPLGVVIARE